MKLSKLELLLDVVWKLGGQEALENGLLPTAKGTQAREAYGQEKQSTVRPAPSFLLRLLSSMSSVHCWGLTGLLAHTSSYYITYKS